MTPEGDSADFDAMDHGEHLYEVKTGYRWLAFDSNTTRKAATVARFYGQAVNQHIVAERCGHTLSWHFNDAYAASYFFAKNAPHPAHREVPMLVDVWYHPFDCPQDSDG